MDKILGKRLREFSFGYLGPKRFFNECYSLIYINFTENEFVINPLFRKSSIPIEYIEKIVSEERLFIGGRWWPNIDKWLKVIHHYPKAPKEIYFVSTDFNSWLHAFEKKGIRIEDALGLKDANNLNLKMWKNANNPLATSVYFATLMGLIGVIMESLNLNKGIWLMYKIILAFIAITMIFLLIRAIKILYFKLKIEPYFLFRKTPL